MDKDNWRALGDILLGIVLLTIFIVILALCAHGETLPQNYQEAVAIIKHKGNYGHKPQTFTLSYEGKVNLLTVPGKFLGNPFALSKALEYIKPEAEAQGFGVVYDKSGEAFQVQFQKVVLDGHEPPLEFKNGMVLK